MKCRYCASHARLLIVLPFSDVHVWVCLRHQGVAILGRLAELVA